MSKRIWAAFGAAAFLLTLGAGQASAQLRCSPPPVARPLPPLTGSANFSLNVRDFNAKGEGVTDDAAAFQNAIHAAPLGGQVLVPPGQYLLGSTVTIDKPVSLIGTGLGSQLYTPVKNASLLLLRNVQGVTVRGLYLGSAGTGNCSRLIHLAHSHHNIIEDIGLLGGYVGIHLEGSLLNTLSSIRSGANVGMFYRQNDVSKNQVWIYGERFDDANGDHQDIASNANTIINPRLEGGANGIFLLDGVGEGSMTVIGGTIEGNTEDGVLFSNTFGASSITGTHFECNATDISIGSSSNIRISSIIAVPVVASSTHQSDCPGRRSGLEISDGSRNIQVTDSVIALIRVDAGVKRVHLQNITFGTPGTTPDLDYCAYASINLPPRMTTANPHGPLHTISAGNVGNYCAGE